MGVVYNLILVIHNILKKGVTYCIIVVVYDACPQQTHNAVRPQKNYSCVFIIKEKQVFTQARSI